MKKTFQYFLLAIALTVAGCKKQTPPVVTPPPDYPPTTAVEPAPLPTPPDIAALQKTTNAFMAKLLEMEGANIALLAKLNEETAKTMAQSAQIQKMGSEAGKTAIKINKLVAENDDLTTNQLAALKKETALFAKRIEKLESQLSGTNTTTVPSLGASPAPGQPVSTNVPSLRNAVATFDVNADMPGSVPVVLINGFNKDIKIKIIPPESADEPLGMLTLPPGTRRINLLPGVYTYKSTIQEVGGNGKKEFRVSVLPSVRLDGYTNGPIHGGVIFSPDVFR